MRLKIYCFVFVFVAVQCQHSENGKRYMKSKVKNDANLIVTVQHLKLNYLKDEQIHFTLLTRKEQLVCSVLLEEFNDYEWYETGWSIDQKGLRSDKSVQLFELKANKPVELSFSFQQINDSLIHRYRLKIDLCNNQKMIYSVPSNINDEKNGKNKC